MLPAQYRMRRSADFGATVKRGRRAVQANIVVYGRQSDPLPDGEAIVASPKVGLIIAKSVGSAVDRHRVARRLRHAARDVLGDLQPAEHVVIRALPSSKGAKTDVLRTQLRDGLRSIRRPGGVAR
ncbi:ribonuclease P protein component [[Mycobacterium] nativiensis]|uniref:Ribonuclease P protein component n=1 Tax=[Mycobacterium] nativiensis TaxID=2855503 RepID=A0ABU5Y4R0_9MYCO|nr:ribonuclease P protein component [Mycolicibacter sp. MYC340]MEB3033935.1 ribonuclease P protein component [Mycolicibacter sp. MYC340]